MHEEEASTEQLIHAALQIARRCITGDNSPQPEKEVAGEDSYRNRAMARAIELADYKIRSNDGHSSQG